MLNRAHDYEPVTMHWTHTGPYAGMPFCGVDKAVARANGDTFEHPAYSREAYEAQRERVCRECLKEWDDAV